LRAYGHLWNQLPTVIPYLKGMARMRALVSLDTMSIITK